MADAIIGGLVGSIVPVALGGIAFAMAWGRLSRTVEVLESEINRLREWRGKHTDWHAANSQGD